MRHKLKNNKSNRIFSKEKKKIKKRKIARKIKTIKKSQNQVILWRI